MLPCHFSCLINPSCGGEVRGDGCFSGLTGVRGLGEVEMGTSARHPPPMPRRPAVLHLHWTGPELPGVVVSLVSS